MPSCMQIKNHVVASVSTHAVAGGLELYSARDDTHMAEMDAISGDLCGWFGVLLIRCGTVRPQAMVGLGRALGMLCFSPTA